MNPHLVHGGALQAALDQFGGRREDWLDLSTGINPLPATLPPLPSELFTRLPEADLERDACGAARHHYGATATAGLVAAPGSQALISLLPHLLPDGPAAILRPAYGEHARTFAAAGRRILAVASVEEVPDDVVVAIFVNPNNPDGRRFERRTLLALGDRLAARGGWLVVDEAFMDADPRESVADEAGRPGLVVLRSFGKFFGLAGLRLGFALTTPALAASLAARLGPWAVSGPALFAGAKLMADRDGIDRLRCEIARRATETRRAIADAGFTPQGDAGLFALVETPRAGAVFDALARRRILVRPFADPPDWLRFGLTHHADEAARLARALREARAEAGL
ncbi:threonine-phosphate decarboxylase CobD [Aureimonas sp. Leaf324]|uniref:threonine-phosphate decarboxylase CobD n=1 Tax=Aureimonas sp. Leaf324 TaxID=1736336 RepID=UPI000700BFFD|nr:threonine-phosphate decarboxylase CobD [Aureimonas sp. Leaf324]KQQ80625.1 threonine-phosphate decarboxylase [Aureimonas sp. Leaf324]